MLRLGLKQNSVRLWYPKTWQSTQLGIQQLRRPSELLQPPKFLFSEPVEILNTNGNSLIMIISLLHQHVPQRKPWLLHFVLIFWNLPRNIWKSNNPETTLENVLNCLL